jgi:oligopeptide transport system ATP-binding protein
MGTNGAYILRVEDLKKYFPLRRGLLGRGIAHVKAVDGISFAVRRGEILGWVGESGCGKSTLGRTVLQLERPTSGKVFFDGQDLTQLGGEQLRRLRTKMQIIFQNPYSSLNPRMPIGRALIEPMVVHGIARGKQAQERAIELLQLVGLNPYFINRFPSEFSGGQRQRIGIARALALNPSFIVCDEPISSLDVSIQAQIINLLQRLQQQLGLTYLFISHDLRMVQHISDRIGVMYLGKLVEIGPTEEMVHHPLHPYTQALWEAVPIPDPEVEEKRQVAILEGDVPTAANPPSGCRFHTRCPYVMPVCREEEPALVELAPGHFAACHLHKR